MVSSRDEIRTWRKLKGATRPNEGDGFLFCVFVLSDAPSVRASALRVFKRDVGFHLITTAVHHIMRISQNRSDFGFVRCAKAACGSRTNKLLMSCEPGLPNHRRRSHFSAMEISCCQPCVRATDQKQTTEQEPCFRQTKMQDDASRQGVVKSIRPALLYRVQRPSRQVGLVNKAKSRNRRMDPQQHRYSTRSYGSPEVSQRGPLSARPCEGTS